MEGLGLLGIGRKMIGDVAFARTAGKSRGRFIRKKV